jgi:hypothetical protein
MLPALDLERITDEYVKQTSHMKVLEKMVKEYKDLLTKAVDAQGEPDAKGHKWLTVGKYVLQRQKRQGDKCINTERATQWAQDKGIWDQVKVVRVELDQEALLAYMFEHRDDKELEAEFQTMYDTPAPVWAFMAPVIEDPIDY